MSSTRFKLEGRFFGETTVLPLTECARDEIHSMGNMAQKVIVIFFFIRDDNRKAIPSILHVGLNGPCHQANRWARSSFRTEIPSDFFQA